MCRRQVGAVGAVRGIDGLNVQGEGAFEPISVQDPLCREVEAIEALLERGGRGQLGFWRDVRLGGR